MKVGVFPLLTEMKVGINVSILFIMVQSKPGNHNVFVISLIWKFNPNASVEKNRGRCALLVYWNLLTTELVKFEKKKVLF